MNVKYVSLYILESVAVSTLTGYKLHWTTNFKKFFFVSVMNMLLIYLFASMKLEKRHKKDYLALVLKIRSTVLFYEMG